MPKGILLAGGLAKRLSPISNYLNKHLIPIYDTPMINFSLQTLVDSGIDEVLTITNSSDVAILKALIGDGSENGIKISYEIQAFPGGIAQALLIAEDFIGNESVALALGDNLFFGPDFATLTTNARILNRGATVFAFHVEEPRSYAVLETSENGMPLTIAEKPLNPLSNQILTGLYFYDNRAVDYAKSLVPSERGELEITDLNRIYLSEGRLNVVNLDDRYTWFDAGTFESIYHASCFVRRLRQNAL